MLQQVLDFLSRPEVMVVGLGLAIFLALYWVVRGAPIGQASAEEPAEAPSPGRRDRAGALVVFGLLLIPAGALVAGRYGIPWSIPVFLAGFGLILRVQATTRAYRHVSPTLRRVDEFSRTALSVSVLGGILIVGNVFAFKYGGRAIDFTRDEAFTLSTKSVNVVQSLKVPLRLTLVFGREQQSRRHQGLVRHLARLYQAENPQKVEVEFLDPYSPSQASRRDDLLKRVPDLAVALARGGDDIVLEYGEAPDLQTSVIELRNLFRDSNGREGGGSVATEFSGEDAVTSTLVRFLERKRVQVGFTTGHGEPSIDDYDTQQTNGIGVWRSRLGSFGIEAVELNLVGQGVPDSVEVAVVVAPKKAFDKPEVERLTEHLKKGRTLMVVMNGQVETGLEDLIRNYNVVFDRGVIYDNQRNNGNRSLVITLPIRKGDSPLSDSLAGQPCLVPGGSSIHVSGSKPGEKEPVNPGVMIAPFLKTAQSSRLTANEPSGERQGPFNVGAACSERGDSATGKKPKPVVVVLSSGLMASNAYFPFNADLLMNSIQWLRGKTESAGLSPKVHNSTLFVADPNLQFRLHAVPTIVSFAMIIGLGLTTYLARRS